MTKGYPLVVSVDNGGDAWVKLEFYTHPGKWISISLYLMLSRGFHSYYKFTAEQIYNGDLLTHNSRCSPLEVL